MFVAIEQFMSDIVDEYGEHPVLTYDGGTWYPPQACQFLKLSHHIHSSYEKSIIIERMMQYKIELMNVLMMTTFHVEREEM
jgi:hypothetical protein